MSREVAGKIFCTPEEAGVTPPTEAEIAQARKLFNDFQSKMDAVPQNRIRKVSPKFWDDTSGTEYEYPKEG